jgi:hypothetical protein
MSVVEKFAASLGYGDFNDTTKDNVGLHWDRDTGAFYGDPAWEVWPPRMMRLDPILRPYRVSMR